VADLVVIVPSRGRPKAAREFIEAFGETRTTAHLRLAVDFDDPTAPEYEAVTGKPFIDNCVLEGQPSSMVKALNAVAIALATQEDPPFALGFMGDDHRPHTEGWDEAYLEALHELGTGIVYGDDLLQGENLPTQVAMTTDIVRALGYMAPPTLTHLFVDNFWRDLGLAAQCLRYLPDVVVEHLHPIAGKAEWDEGHKRVNAPSMYAADRAAYTRYLATRFRADVAKVEGLR
jgi:hypothetical protein